MTRWIVALVGLLMLLARTPSAHATGSITDLGNATSSSGSTLSLTTSTNVPAGAMIFVWVYENTSFPNWSTAGSMTDSVGNTYALNRGSGNVTTCWPPDNDLSYGLGCFFAVYLAKALPSGGTITYTRYTSGAPVAMSAFFLTGYTPTGGSAGTLCTAAGGASTTMQVDGTPLGIDTNGAAFAGAAWDSSATSTQSSGWSTPPDHAVTGSTSIFGGNISGLISGIDLYWAPTLSASSKYAAVICQVLATSPFPFSPNIIP